MRNVRKRTEHRKAEINSVASSINANGTPAISRNVGTKGHNARAKKSNESLTGPLIIHSLSALLSLFCMPVAFCRIHLPRPPLLPLRKMWASKTHFRRTLIRILEFTFSRSTRSSYFTLFYICNLCDLDLKRSKISLTTTTTYTIKHNITCIAGT